MSDDPRLQHATALHQAGRLAEAQALYQQILAQQPNHPDALHLLGVLAHQTGRNAPAEALMRRAIAAAPAANIFHNSLGNVLRAEGRAAEAEASYRAALRLNPNVPDVHHHLALALKDQGRAADAQAALRQAIRLQKDFVPARIDLGNLLVEAGNAADAEACLRTALRAAPRNKLALNALGLALAAQRKHAAALEAFDQARAEDPAYLSPLANRAASLVALDRMEEAEVAYRAALAVTPEAQDLRLGLGRVLLALQRGPELEALLQGLRAERPNDADVLHGIGVAQAMQDRHAEALATLRQATEASPESGLAWHGMAMILRDLARWPESLEAFAKAAALAPEDADFNANYAYALMVNGRYQDAWPHFEYRVKKPGNARLREPKWNGQETTRTVLIHAEQGLGDNIQFARWIPVAAQRARVVLGCPQSLRALFSGLEGVAEIAVSEPVPRYDLHCPIMSLPVVLGVAPRDFAATVPYLHADPARVTEWRERLAHLPGRRVGLVWAGNPKYPADRRRSVPPALLAPLLDTPGASFVSLQMGDAKAAMPAGLVFDAAPFLGDFTDTAALIKALDLVISVDTSVAHLAGALGAPIWLLNRADTDWRWGLQGAESLWYPSLRQFRQPKPGDWDGCVAAVAGRLRQEEGSVLF